MCKIRRGRSAFSRSTGSSRRMDSSRWLLIPFTSLSLTPPRVNCALSRKLLSSAHSVGNKKCKRSSFGNFGEENLLDLHRVRSRTSGFVCVLISQPHDTALRGRLPSENQFEHGPRTLRMPFDKAAASVNGDSLAFGFSRPRYAAFRIKPGFTWVLCYWGPCLTESAIHASLRERVPY